MKAQITATLIIVLSGCSSNQENLDASAATNNDGQASPLAQSQKSKLRRVEEAATAERDRKECGSWIYDEQKLQVDLAEMRPVQQEEWGRVCYQYSCSYQGKMQVEGVEKFLVVNAGGWMSSSEDGRTEYFASDKQLPGFIAWCNCCEETEEPE